jgi:hypothetical protein
MKQEDMIRDRTAVILDAYWELTGMESVPDIKEFLQLRKEAIKELRIPASGPVVRTSGPQRHEEALHTRKEESAYQQPPAERKPVERPVEKRPAERKPVEEAPVQTADMQEEEPEPQEELSDFDILRRIKDPWN